MSLEVKTQVEQRLTQSTFGAEKQRDEHEEHGHQGQHDDLAAVTEDVHERGERSL